MANVVTQNEMGFGLLRCVFCSVVSNISEECIASMFMSTLQMKGNKLPLNGKYFSRLHVMMM